ncbi:MAG TPA: FMN-binding protein [Chitinivibrionales bacterium]|jgi:uncharacterized protein with FMN-binding domain|nr:FMN-binding protein [Chitinivibrionales bacterium]
MKKVSIVLWAIGGFVVVVGALFFFLNLGMGEVQRLVINSVDLSKITDGVYQGSYHRGRWTYDVQVTVKAHAITAVKNTNKRMGIMKDFNDKAETAIIKKQSPQIDVVSGASVNTKALAKAVENALAAVVK